MNLPLLEAYIMMLLVVASAVCIPSCSFEADKVKIDVNPQTRETASDATLENVTMSKIIPEGKPSKYYAKLIGKPCNSAWLKELQAGPNAIPFMQRLALAQDPTPRAKWYSDQSPEQVLAGVRSQLTKLQQDGKLMKKIALDDLSCEEKVGPQGGHPAIRELMPKLCEYFGLYTKARESVVPDLEAQSKTFASEAWQQAKQRFIARCGLKRRLRPASTRNVIEKLRKNGQLSTNAGFVPGAVFSKRSNPKTIEIVERLCSTKNGWKQPAILGERSTRGKTRFIFMASMATNVKEQQYLFPFMDLLRKLNLPSLSAWEGNEHTKAAITKTVFNVEGKPEQSNSSTMPQQQDIDYELHGPGEEDGLPYDTIISTDFTGMDQRFNSACVQEIFSVIKEAFQPTYWDELDEIAKWISEVPVLYSLEDGTIWQTDELHGMPSGSGYTNGSETVFDEVMWDYAKSLGHTNLGDDGAARVTWLKDDAAGRFADLARSLGMTANPDKQLVSKVRAHYLQRYYYRNYFVGTWEGKPTLGGVYPIMLATNSLLYPERFHNPKKWNSFMETIRNLMIVENTSDHPLFPWFCNFVGKGDKYIKEFLKLGNKELLELETEARSLPGFIPSYNQESKDKRLFQFKTYQMWKREFSV